MENRRLYFDPDAPLVFAMHVVESAAPIKKSEIELTQEQTTETKREKEREKRIHTELVFKNMRADRCDFRVARSRHLP